MDESTSLDKADIIIIGGGVSGLAAGKEIGQCPKIDRIIYIV